MEYFARGAPDACLDAGAVNGLLVELIEALDGERKLRRVLLLPPDITRIHSGAGELTARLYRLLAPRADIEILPAIGTHAPMTAPEIARMFPGVPADRFRVHDWRRDLVRLGEVPSDFVAELSEGKFAAPIAIEINRLLVEGGWDVILSIGQVVPHEVVGIANHAKNVYVGVGGADTINKTHFLGAVYGMERIMGRARTPVRAVFDYAARHFGHQLPIRYLLSARGRAADGRIVTRGLFAGDDEACFLRGADLARRVNLDQLDRPIRKAVVYLDPAEFRSTWLGNKAIYRTRMALADEGELVILAPGVKEFGEDPTIDRLIRRHGYHGTLATLEKVRGDPELAANLSAAAHLIHGSSEGRFRVTYCAGGLKRAEVESVGFQYAPLAEMTRHYDPARLVDGYNRMPDGEEVFFVSNPGLGLWTARSIE